MKQYDTLIIGGGPAGYSAALYIARNARTVAVIEQLSPGGQMATTGIIENYPGFEEGIDGFELAEKMQAQAERFGAETIYETVEELSLDKTLKEVKTKEATYYAKTVVIATGAHPRRLNLPAETNLRGKGVAYCATCDGMLYKDKEVVVVGGGNSAIADALFLDKICKRVTLIHRRDQLRASRVYEKALKESSIEFIWNSKVVDIIAQERVSGVIVEDLFTKTQRTLSCDGIFVAIGRIPDSALCKGQLDLDEQGYIKAGESTKTNLDGVYAIGDVRTKGLRQIVTAVSDGAVCSQAIETYLMEQETITN